MTINFFKEDKGGVFVCMWIKQVLVDLIRRKWFLILFVTLFFCMGIFFGATAAKTIGQDLSDQLAVYFNSFLEKVTDTPVGDQLYFRHNILSNLYILIAIYILGLTVIGIPLIPVAVFSKGFVMGFTIGFLIREKAVKGLLFAFISVLPHNLLVVPAIIAGGVAALSFSGLLVKRRFGSPKNGVMNHMGIYTTLMFALCLVAGAAGLMETYLTPVFIKSTAVYLR